MERQERKGGGGFSTVKTLTMPGPGWIFGIGGGTRAEGGGAKKLVVFKDEREESQGRNFRCRVRGGRWGGGGPAAYHSEYFRETSKPTYGAGLGHGRWGRNGWWGLLPGPRYDRSELGADIRGKKKTLECPPRGAGVSQAGGGAGFIFPGGQIGTNSGANSQFEN